METIERTLNLSPTSESEDNYLVTGYATTFEPYVLFNEDGEDFYEVMERTAFDDSDMSDVIMQYDHEGRVFARTSNGTLTVNPDEHGLKIEADLSRTAKARDLYEDIKAGNITKMSIRCSVESHIDRSCKTHKIDKVKRVYDVSAVSLPANDQTSIVVRKFKEIDLQTKERARLALKLRLEEI